MGWQPIETADEESQDTILVSVPEWQTSSGETTFPATVVPARFCGYRSRNGKMSLYDLSDCDRDGGYNDVYPDPTHWMPLPEPA